MPDKIAFIGDIHGDRARLADLLARLGDENRNLVFLGDYVDHGPDSRAVVDILLETANRKPNSVFLSGNHEIGLLAYLSGKLSFLEFGWMGGLPTIRSYLDRADQDVRREFAEAVPNLHVEFLSGCRPFFETNEFFASHAGVNPALPESREFADVVLGRHSSPLQDHLNVGKLAGLWSLPAVHTDTFRQQLGDLPEHRVWNYWRPCDSVFLSRDDVCASLEFLEARELRDGETLGREA